MSRFIDQANETSDLITAYMSACRDVSNHARRITTLKAMMDRTLQELEQSYEKVEVIHSQIVDLGLALD